MKIKITYKYSRLKQRYDSFIIIESKKKITLTEAYSFVEKEECNLFLKDVKIKYVVGFNVLREYFQYWDGVKQVIGKKLLLSDSFFIKQLLSEGYLEFEYKEEEKEKESNPECDKLRKLQIRRFNGSLIDSQKTELEYLEKKYNNI